MREKSVSDVYMWVSAQKLSPPPKLPKGDGCQIKFSSSPFPLSLFYGFANKSDISFRRSQSATFVPCSFRHRVYFLHKRICIQSAHFPVFKRDIKNWGIYRISSLRRKCYTSLPKKLFLPWDQTHLASRPRQIFCLLVL